MPACTVYSNTQCPDITLKWLEDETFFSICSRQHAAWGNLHLKTTFDMLFDSISHATKHDFPHSLDTLQANIRSVWGDAESIIFRHTIFPLFMPFQSQARIEAVMSMLKGDSLGSIKYRLGLITGRFGAEHALKACSCCIETDISCHGVAYWHLSHQFPGVLICPVHNVWLQESALNRRWAGRFQLALPTQAALIPQPAKVLDPITLDAVTQLANSVLDLASLGPSKSFNPLLVKSVYRNALGNLGYRIPTSPQAAASFAQHSSRIQPFHPLTSLPTSAQKASNYIEQLIRSPRGCSHPLKHLVMITWLFGKVGTFIDAYDHLATFQEPDHLDTTHPLYTDKKISKPPEPNRAKQLRPKVLKPTVRAQILRLLSRGTPKNKICSQFGITISTINKLLRAEPLVKKSWTTAKLEKDILEHRRNWISLSQMSPSSSANVIRSRNPKLYAWLYRNDKDWLIQESFKLPTGRNGNNSKIDWIERDIELETSVRNALMQILSESQKDGFRKHNIYTLIPSLFSCLQKSNQYPKTRALLFSLKQNKSLT